MNDYSNNSIKFLEECILNAEKEIFALKLKAMGLGSENMIFVNFDSKTKGNGSFEEPYKYIEDALLEQSVTAKSIFVSGKPVEEVLRSKQK